MSSEAEVFSFSVTDTELLKKLDKIKADQTINFSKLMEKILKKALQ